MSDQQNSIEEKMILTRQLQFRRLSMVRLRLFQNSKCLLPIMIVILAELEEVNLSMLQDRDQTFARQIKRHISNSI
jgi:hypothetical protein